MTDSKVEQVAHKLGIPWPSAEEGQLRAAADGFDAAARAVDAQRQACTAAVRSVTAHNTGGGMEQFAAFWDRYDGVGPGGGALPATAQACRDTASALRRFADEVERTKDSIKHKVEIAGAALVVGAVAAIFTFGASEAVAVAAAAVIADFAAAAGVALSATVASIAATALTGAAFGAVEAVAIDALVVQPMSVALDEQQGFSFGELVRAGEFGVAGGFLGGGAGGALSRLPALTGSAAAGFPRLSATLDGLTRFTGGAPGRLTTNGLLGAGVTEALTGGHATAVDLLGGTIGGLAAAGGRRRTGLVEPEAGPATLVRDDNDFGSLVNFMGVRKAHLEPSGALVAANPDGRTTVVEHVIGDNRAAEVKGNSPYISFKPPDNSGKSFGDHRMEVDLVRLRADIAAGRLAGTSVLTPAEIQGEIQAALEVEVGRRVRLPEVMTPQARSTVMREFGLSGEAAVRARRLLLALQNTQRDQEWLVRGRIPAGYLTGPTVNALP